MQGLSNLADVGETVQADRRREPLDRLAGLAFRNRIPLEVRHRLERGDRLFRRRAPVRSQLRDVLAQRRHILRGERERLRVHLHRRRPARHSGDEAVVCREAIVLDPVQRTHVSVKLAAVALQVRHRLTPFAGRSCLWHVERGLDLRVEMALLGLVRVKLHAERHQADLIQPILHHVERGLLLGDEEDAPPVREVVRDDVCDGLRLARAGRTM